MNKWLNNKLDQKKKAGNGFTLIELIVVVTILGILAAIVVYAVGDLTKAADTASAGTTSSEVTQAEAQYCQQDGMYGTVPDLVNAGLLNNPSPSLQIYVSAIPTNAQIYAGCGTSSTGGSAAGSVYDVFPQTITQPDGSQANIPTPPTKVAVGDQNTDGLYEQLAVLGVTPIGGEWSAPSAAELPEYGPYGEGPELNLGNLQAYGTTSAPNPQLFAAAKPQLILAASASPSASNTKAFEAIAPFYSNESSSEPGAWQNATGASNLALTPGASLAQPLPGDPTILAWYASLVQLGTILNKQAQAAAFITAFENQAATVIPSLQGLTASVVIPVLSGTTLSKISVVGPGSTYSQFLDYLGITVEGCPGCELSGGTAISVASLTQADVPGTYLEVISLNDANTATAATLSSAPWTTLTQFTNSAPNCWQGGSAQGTTPCYVWGPTYNPEYYPPTLGGSGTGGSITPVLPAAVAQYCSIAGVVQDSAGNLCPGQAGPAVAGAGAIYNPVNFPQGISQSNGPLSQLIAMLPPGTGPSPTTPTILQDF